MLCSGSRCVRAARRLRWVPRLSRAAVWRRTRGHIAVLRAAMDQVQCQTEARYIFGVANKPEVLEHNFPLLR